MSKKVASTLETIAKTIIDAGDYQTIREQEHTKRASIQAQSSVALEQVCSQRQIIERALTDTFTLRKLGLKAQISAMDKALEKDDVEALHIVMEHISATIQSSPLKDLAEMRKQLADDTFKLKLG